jgi:hypothetical protein
MLSGSYVMINQLIKSIWKVAHLEYSLLYKCKQDKVNNLITLSKLEQVDLK